MWLLLALVAAPAAASAQAPGLTPVRPTDRLQTGLDNATAARDALRARFERFGAHGRPDMPLALSESPGDPPFEGAAWQTGEWQWIDGRWKWTAGQWVSPDAFDDVDYAAFDVDTDGPGGEDPNPDLGVGYNEGAFEGLYLADRHEHHIRTASRPPLTENVKDPAHNVLIIRDHRHIGGSNDRPSGAWSHGTHVHGSSGGSSSSGSGRWTNDSGWSSSNNNSKSDKNSDPDSNKDTSGVGNFTHGR
jgi:hypothetical protein